MQYSTTRNYILQLIILKEILKSSPEITENC